jgi:hypothetical protein
VRRGRQRGPSHAHICPVFLAWSHRPTVAFLTAERDEMRRLGREAEMERDTLAHANELLREQLVEARAAARWLWVSIQRDEDLSEADVRNWWPWLLEDQP